jgi:hypothetical protein
MSGKHRLYLEVVKHCNNLSLLLTESFTNKEENPDEIFTEMAKLDACLTIIRNNHPQYNSFLDKDEYTKALDKMLIYTRDKELWRERDHARTF